MYMVEIMLKDSLLGKAYTDAYIYVQHGHKYISTYISTCSGYTHSHAS